MTALLTQFTITEVSTGYWRMTFSNPPINLADPDTITELQHLDGLIESDDTLQVVVLDSAHPDFFINRYDVSRVAETPVAPGPTGLPAFIDTTTRLTTSPVVTIASIRGRCRGGGGGVERLPLLVGRARALEIILGSDDFDAATAAKYGWVNRALPDDELDGYVDNLARRIASFDKPALAEAKRLINRRTLPSPDDLIQTQDVFLGAFSSPTVQERGARLRRRASEVGPDFEARMGHYLADLSADST